MKKGLIILLLFLSFAASGYRKPDVYVIDATKNAYLHNNMGLRYMNERLYYAAIQGSGNPVLLMQLTLILI